MLDLYDMLDLYERNYKILMKEIKDLLIYK